MRRAVWLFVRLVVLKPLARTWCYASAVVGFVDISRSGASAESG